MFESMRMLSGLLIGGAFNSEASELAYHIICLILLIAMLICAVAAIVIVLFQPGNSTGIDALGGSSETFFGKPQTCFCADVISATGKCGTTVALWRWP